MQCMVQGLAHLLSKQTPATNAGMGFLSWLGLLLLCSPPRSLGFAILGEIFAYVTVFLILPIEIVTFRLSGWCMLDVFFLPVFTRLGHERQDLSSPCDGMHVRTD